MNVTAHTEQKHMTCICVTYMAIQDAYYLLDMSYMVTYMLKYTPI